MNKKDIFSSRQIGKLIGADASSVNRWIDSGKLVAYRTPGGHRRVQRHELLKFLTGLGMPIPPELQTAPRVLLVGNYTPAAMRAVGTNGWDVEFANDLSQGLMLVGSTKPDIVVLSLFLDHDDAEISYEAKRSVKAFNPTTKVLELTHRLKPAALVAAIENL